MSEHLFGKLRPRLNTPPLILIPGIAAIGYAIGGASAAWWGVAAWLALVFGAALSCALHTLRNAQEETMHAGRSAFDYDAKSARS